MNKAHISTPIWIVLAALLALAGCQPYMAEPQGGAQVLVPAGTVTLEPYPPPPAPPRRATLPPDWRPTMDTSIVMLTPRPAATPCSPEDQDCLPGRGTPWPTPEGGFEPTWTPPPSPTRPPLLLTPIPKGEPPADLSSLYYVADSDGKPELRVIGMDRQGRRWSESRAAYDPSTKDSAMPMTGLHPSPDGKYLALEFLGDGYGEIKIIERTSGQAWCPLLQAPKGCWGGFWGWTSDNHFLFQPFDVPPEGVISLGIVVVDVATGQYHPLDLPVSPDRAYSLARNMSPSPDGSRVAYSITDSKDGELTSEIWTMRINGTDKQLTHRVKGLITALSWSPVGEQLIYVYQSEPSQLKPSELWRVNVDGSDAKLLAADLTGGEKFRPTWSPDGRYVAFVQLDRPITFDGAYVILAWSNLCVVDTITGYITRLSSFEKREANFPTWSPDGRFVAFMSTGRLEEETVYSEVWVASVDGKQLYAISGMAKWYNALAWLPTVSSSQGDSR